MRLSWFRRTNYFDLMREENRKVVAAYEALVTALKNEIAAKQVLLDEREKMISLLKKETTR